jgi:hypothetical protein
MPRELEMFVVWEQANVGSRSRLALLLQIPTHRERRSGTMSSRCAHPAMLMMLIQQRCATASESSDKQCRSGIGSLTSDSGFLPQTLRLRVVAPRTKK